jgi:hypothetical protein
MRLKNVMPDYDLEDALHLLGLTRRRSILGVFLPAIGLLAAGAAIGAGVGLAFAPSSGRRLREDVSGRLDHLRERVKREAAAEAKPRFNDVNASS